MSENVTMHAEVQRAVRYIYPDGTIPVKDLVDFDFESGLGVDDVPQVSGAVGFDFVHLIYFDFRGRTLRHLLGEAETYYWGVELDETDLEAAGIPTRNRTGRSVLTTLGAIIPLRDHEFVISPSFRVDF